MWKVSDNQDFVTRISIGRLMEILVNDHGLTQGILALDDMTAQQLQTVIAIICMQMLTCYQHDLFGFLIRHSRWDRTTWEAQSVFSSFPPDTVHTTNTLKVRTSYAHKLYYYEL